MVGGLRSEKCSAHSARRSFVCIGVATFAWRPGGRESWTPSHAPFVGHEVGREREEGEEEEGRGWSSVGDAHGRGDAVAWRRAYGRGGKKGGVQDDDPRPGRDGDGGGPFLFSFRPPP